MEGLTRKKKLEQAKNDANFLAEAELIKSNAARLLAAKRAAIEMARKKRQENTELMKAVSKIKPVVSNPRKTNRPMRKQKNNFNVFKKI